MNLKEQFPELFYPVRKVPSNELVPGLLTNSYNEFKVVVETPKGLKEVNSCSDVYRVMPNEDIILAVWESLSKIYPIKLIPQVYQDSIFKFDFTIDVAVDMGKRYNADPIFPSLTVWNSYNGKIKLSSNLSILRQVCTNGMMIAEELFPGQTFMHTPNNGEGLAIAEIMKMVNHFMESRDEFLEPFAELRSMPVFNIAHKVDEIIEATKFPKNQRESVIDRISYETATLNLPLTDWVVYNGFNYQLNHNPDIALAPHRKSQLDSDIQLHLLRN